MFAHAGDHANARAYYDRACSGSDGDGCFELGWEHDQGDPVADRGLAIGLYRKGCDLGSLLACNNLGARLAAVGDERGRAEAIAKLCRLPMPFDPIDAAKLADIPKICGRR
jgi:TPR repeat protein